MKRFPLKRQLIILECIIVALCIAIPVATFAKSSSGEPHQPVIASKVTQYTDPATGRASAEAAPVPGGALTSVKPVHGFVSTPDRISYTFTAKFGVPVT